MNIFHSMRKICEQLGIHQPHTFGPEISARFWVVLVGVVISSLLTLLALLIEAKTFQEYSDCFYGFTTSVLCILFSVVVLWKASNIFELIEKFEATIGNRMEDPVSKIIYGKTNLKCEKWTKCIAFLLLKVTCFGVTIPILIICYYFYFTTDLENEAFHLPFLVWFPFEWKHPILYLVAFTAVFWMVCCVDLLSVTTISYVVSTCCMLIGFLSDLKQDVNTLNAIGKDAESHTELKVKLFEFVEFHVVVKDFVRKFTEFYEFIFLGIFLWSNLAICSSLLMVQFELSQDNPNPVILIIQIGIVFWSFFIIILFCNFGENITSEFMDVNDQLYQCDWHLFPYDIQRMLPTILINTQRKTLLRGFGNILSTRETLKTVVNKAISFYMILRQF